MSTLTTHVLDTALGKPAQGIMVTLGRDGMTLGSGVTDADGRLHEISGGAELDEGDYTLTFSVGDYFSKAQREAFYSEITVSFKITSGAEHYHVPLLLSPFGYSTYRGS